MVTRFDSWDSYFWEPGGDVLRNLYGLRDAAELERKEYAETSAQALLIANDSVSIPRTYNAEHLRLIHRELFRNVYEWAGQYRTVGTSKGANDFADPADIDRYLTDAHSTIMAAHWPATDRDEFAAAAATVFAYVNTGGPFP